MMASSGDFLRSILQRAAEAAKPRPPSDADRVALREIVARRQVRALTHFTRLSNVPGILARGLVPARDLRGISEHGAQFNDDSRIDGYPDANPMSVSFPNYKMFYALRKTHGGEWAVLAVSPDVLLEFECLFCNTNAAHRTELARSREHRRTPAAFEEMFGESARCLCPQGRGGLGLPDACPTDPQAEVLVRGVIPVKFIDSIHVNNAKDLESVRGAVASRGLSLEVALTPAAFSGRKDSQYWKAAAE